MNETVLVTGAFGYTGTYLRQRLQAAGNTVRTLTSHAPRGADQTIEVFPYTFDDEAALTRAFTGVTTFYNTYWVRYAPGGTTYEQAVANTEALFAAARRAGVERIVHVSITNPDPTSFYAYYRGKARLEDALAGSQVSHAIVRPTVIFGGDDILINNIAWLLRHFHAFAIPGDGRYRLRPVHVGDLADLCVHLGGERENVVVDAVGPESFTFEDLVGTLAQATGTRWWPVHLPPAVVAVLVRGLSVLARDVVLTRDEIDGLMAELVMSDAQTSCPTRLTDYLRENGDVVGRIYQSELARRRPPSTGTTSAVACASRDAW
jgi:NADH dehydrogenase